MPRKNTAAQLIKAMRRLFHNGYQSMSAPLYGAEAHALEHGHGLVGL